MVNPLHKQTTFVRSLILWYNFPHDISLWRRTQIGRSGSISFSYRVCIKSFGEAEHALREALTGNYTGLKRLLLGENFAMWVGMAGQRDKLQELVQAIPDQGDPFMPPLPAWQNPQFNQYPSSSSFFKNS